MQHIDTGNVEDHVQQEMRYSIETEEDGWIGQREYFEKLIADLYLEGERDAWKAKAAEYKLDRDDLRAQLAAVTAECDRLREALEFYANKRSGGRIARRALGQEGGE